jgi:hypothetical protein
MDSRVSRLLVDRKKPGLPTFGGISLSLGTGNDSPAIRELPAGDGEAHGACSEDRGRLRVSGPRPRFPPFA